MGDATEKVPDLGRLQLQTCSHEGRWSLRLVLWPERFTGSRRPARRLSPCLRREVPPARTPRTRQTFPATALAQTNREADIHATSKTFAFPYPGLSPSPSAPVSDPSPMVAHGWSTEVAGAPCFYRAPRVTLRHCNAGRPDLSRSSGVRSSQRPGIQSGRGLNRKWGRLVWNSGKQRWPQLKLLGSP